MHLLNDCTVNRKLRVTGFVLIFHILKHVT
uniref:Uncharacterized protein n=1 Tax=Anguilla anguilla TaxID=7936 RepID=A0A0E9TWA5_ANGAN